MQSESRDIVRPGLVSQCHSGAGWFHIIAAVSVFNVIAARSGWAFGFIDALGVTSIVDAHFSDADVALGINLAIAGSFVLFGILARRRHTWAFVLGMALYAADGVLLVQSRAWSFVGWSSVEWFSAAFHAFALWCLFGGLRASYRLGRVARQSRP